MIKYLRYFAIPIIVAFLLTVIALGFYFDAEDSIDYERHNDVWDHTNCVYDMAGKMSYEEVEELSAYITQLEEECLTDIVVVTLDDPEYAYLSKVKEYADAFSESYGTGYDYPGGSSIVFVDNWSRGGDGKIHSWVSTTGAVRERLSDSDSEDILNILDEIESDYSDPYDQYREIVGKLARKAMPLRQPFSMLISFIMAVVVAGIYIIINITSKLGDVTTNSHTYVKGGQGNFKIKTDTFRNKTVTKRKIETSSGSGSGGGGGSHGGGGHSR